MRWQQYTHCNNNNNNSTSNLKTAPSTHVLLGGPKLKTGNEERLSLSQMLKKNNNDHNESNKFFVHSLSLFYAPHYLINIILLSLSYPFSSSLADFIAHVNLISCFPMLLLRLFNGVPYIVSVDRQSLLFSSFLLNDIQLVKAFCGFNFCFCFYHSLALRRKGFSHSLCYSYNYSNFDCLWYALVKWC